MSLAFQIYIVASSEFDSLTVFLVPSHLVNGPTGAYNSRYDEDLARRLVNAAKLTIMAGKRHLLFRIHIPQIEFTRPLAVPSIVGWRGCHLTSVIRLFERINWHDGRIVRSNRTSGLPARRAIRRQKVGSRYRIHRGRRRGWISESKSSPSVWVARMSSKAVEGV